MAEEEDVHLCLRCNTHISGLDAYVEHRQSECTEVDPEGRTVDKDGYILIDEESTEVKHVEPKTRGRKRKIAHHTTEGGSPGRPESGKNKQQKTPERVGSPDKGADTSGLESPRRSGRRGIRISYLELLSGVDKSETENTDKSRSSSPRSEKVSSPKKLSKEKGSTSKKDNENLSVKKSSAKGDGKVNLRLEKGGQIQSGERVNVRSVKQKSGGKKADAAGKKKKSEDQKEDDIDTIMQEGDRKGDSSPEQEQDVVYIKDGKFFCHLCETYCTTKKKMDEHCTTKKHLNKIDEDEPSSLISEEESVNRTLEREATGDDVDLQVTGMKGGKLYCYLCKIYGQTKKKMEEHCETNKHTKKLENAKKTGFEFEEEDGEGISDDQQDGKEEGLTELDETVISLQEGRCLCEICEIKCATKKQMLAHCQTAKHKKKAKAALDQENYNLTGADEEVDGNNELLECECCNYSTRRQGQFARHMRSMYHAVRAKMDLFPCHKCHRKFKTEEELIDHAIFHDTPRCAKCKETFESFEQLDEHLDAENHRVKHSCPTCNKSFSSKGNLVYHMRLHDPDAVMQCHLCNFMSPSVQDMRRHIHRHEGYKPYTCSLCEFKTMLKTSLEKHMKTHTIRTKDVECDECDAKFYDVYLLKQHKYVKHNPEYKYMCDFEGCTFGFKFKSSLITHQRMHTQEKPFLCTECGYATSTKYSLTKHIRIHTGEKPFHCDFPNCKYSCRLSTHLSRHKIIHTGAKPFKCPLCSYACNNKQNLRKHLLNTKGHKGAQMYKCKSCDGFSSNSFREYVTHIRKEHADEDEYITFFQISESINKNRKNSTEEEGHELVPAQSNENYIVTEEDLQTFSVVTVVPGKEGSRELTNITILDDREYVQQKLEQVILALEANEAEDESGEGQVSTAIPIQVNDIGELVSLANKDVDMEEHGDTLVIVPDVQTETEISTTEAPTTLVTTTEVAATADEAGEPPQQFVVEFDQSGRLLSEEEMAAATWLHNMGNVQDVTVETIIHDVGGQQEVADEQEVTASQEIVHVAQDQ